MIAGVNTNQQAAPSDIGSEAQFVIHSAGTATTVLDARSR